MTAGIFKGSTFMVCIMLCFTFHWCNCCNKIGNHMFKGGWFHLLSCIKETSNNIAIPNRYFGSLTRTGWMHQKSYNQWLGGNQWLLGPMPPVWEICTEFPSPGFGLVQAQLLQTFREWTIRWEISVSLINTHTNKHTHWKNNMGATMLDWRGGLRGLLLERVIFMETRGRAGERESDGVGLSGSYLSPEQ